MNEYRALLPMKFFLTRYEGIQDRACFSGRWHVSCEFNDRVAGNPAMTVSFPYRSSESVSLAEGVCLMSSGKILFGRRSKGSKARLSRAVAGIVLGVAAALAPHSAYAQGATPQPFQTLNVVPITITGVTAQDGQLMATGVAGSNTFEAPITLTATPNQTPGACPILNLQLGAIHLSLLGLNVDTSDICLDITAQAGQGLLGDLLCAVANLLSLNVPLAQILADLTPQQLTTLNAGLTSTLNQAVFIPLSSSPALIGASCNILNLALGPLDLNLLGLRVELDNCSNGPVTLDVTATPGSGLLGDLLCGLSNVLNNPIERLAFLRSSVYCSVKFVDPPTGRRLNGRLPPSRRSLSQVQGSAVTGGLCLL
jgi:hypothetical protein